MVVVPTGKTEDMGSEEDMGGLLNSCKFLGFCAACASVLAFTNVGLTFLGDSIPLRVLNSNAVFRWVEFVTCAHSIVMAAFLLLLRSRIDRSAGCRLGLLVLASVGFVVTGIEQLIAQSGQDAPVSRFALAFETNNFGVIGLICYAAILGATIRDDRESTCAVRRL